MASRSEPAPESFVLATVKVAAALKDGIAKPYAVSAVVTSALLSLRTVRAFCGLTLSGVVLPTTGAYYPTGSRTGQAAASGERRNLRYFNVASWPRYTPRARTTSSCWS
jgi:hypothetical protein